MSMAGVTAPARRVALLLEGERAPLALTDQSWRLFDAAVAWCGDDPR